MKKLGLVITSAVKDLLVKDFEGVIRQIAGIGFTVIEQGTGHPWSFFGDANSLYKELNLSVPSVHSVLPVGENKQRILDEVQELGCQYIITGGRPDDFKTEDSIKKICEEFNNAEIIASKHGIKIGYHNHDWEFNIKLNGQPVHQLLQKHLNPEVLFEVDTYWTSVGGANPVDVIRQLGNRCPLLHLKDGPCKRGEPNVAVGSGSMDFKQIFAVSGHINTVFVEFDSCASDLLEALRKSAEYLISEGFVKT